MKKEKSIKHCGERKSATKNMCGMSAAIYLAKKMGKGLG